MNSLTDLREVVDVVHPADDLLGRRDHGHRVRVRNHGDPEHTARTSRFTGKIHWVQLDVSSDDHDHDIDPDERIRVAMALQ